MSDRETYMTELVPHIPNEALLPSWLSKEAGMEEDWEKAEKAKLELNAFARDFRRNFPSESFAGIFQVDSKTGAQKQIKSTDEVLGEAYEWLSKKTKGEYNFAKAILDEAKLVDQYTGPIMQMFKNAAGDEVIGDTEKTIETERKDVDDLFGSTGQPNEALREQRESETTAEGEIDDMNEKRLKENRDLNKQRKDYLERTRRIASYGLVLNEQKLQIWKKGELVKELDTEELGGFAIAADEVDALQNAEDVEALFSIGGPTEPPGHAVEHLVPEPPKQEMTSIRVGKLELKGFVKVVNAKDGTCSFVVHEGSSALIGSEIEIPLTEIMK